MRLYSFQVLSVLSLLSGVSYETWNRDDLNIMVGF